VLLTIGVNGTTLDASGTGPVTFNNAGLEAFAGTGNSTLTLAGNNTANPVKKFARQRANRFLFTDGNLRIEKPLLKARTKQSEKCGSPEAALNAKSFRATAADRNV